LTTRNPWRKIEEDENIAVRALAGIEPVTTSFQTVDIKV